MNEPINSFENGSEVITVDFQLPADSLEDEAKDAIREGRLNEFIQSTIQDRIRDCIGRVLMQQLRFICGTTATSISPVKSASLMPRLER